MDVPKISPKFPHFILINSINDDNLRQQAAMGAVFRSISSDPQRARDIVSNLRLNEAQRAQIEKMIEQYQQGRF